MTVLVSMLRGVNVGGHNQIRMEAVRAAYASLGFRDVQTYLQSGNVVFRVGERDSRRVGERVGAEIERTFGFRCGILMRSTSELREVVAENPFAERRGLDAARLVVMFLAEAPGPEVRAKLAGIEAGREELRIGGRELYLYFPDGMGRSKLPPMLDRVLKSSGTARNWRTVTQLLALAEKLEAL